MTSHPIGSATSAASSAKPLTLEPIKAKSGGEAAVGRTVAGALPQAVTASSESMSSKDWVVLGFGGKTETPAEAASTPETAKRRDRLGKEGKDEKSESSDKSTELEGAAVKAYEAAKATRWQRMKGGMASVALAIPGVGAGIGRFIKSFGNFDKERIIAVQKQVMLTQLRDPQFIELYELISCALLPKINEQFIQALEGKKDTLSTALNAQRPVILKLIEVILARGFANLATQVKANAAHIVNFDNQPSLVSVVSLLCLKTGSHISQRQLADIEERYREHQAHFIVHKQKLFPGIESRPKMEESLQMYIQEYIKSTDKSRKNDIKNVLFPDIKKATGQHAADIAVFFATLDALHQKDQELAKVFNQVADDILLNFFPDKLANIPELQGTGSSYVASMAYEGIKEVIVGILENSYKPIEHDVTRHAVWERDLSSRVGTPHLQPIVEAPAALLTEIAKNFIQSDPSVMELAGSAFDKMMHPTEPKDSLTTAPQKQSRVLTQLSLEQLANWIVESAQIMLHTEDPNLASLGHFIKQAMNNLTLAIMAKGAKLILPKEGEVKPAEFVKEFCERILKKIVSLGSEDIPEQFWRDFIQDLPIPPKTKELLTPLLISKARELQEEFRKRFPDFRAIQDMNAEIERKMLSYKCGKQLLKITEEISDKLFEIAQEKGLGLLAEKGSDKIEDLVALFLPGFVIPPDLKKWFQDNVSTLGKEYSAQSLTLLKQGILTILRKAMINMIEKNLTTERENYVEQLSRNIQQAFTRPFAALSKTQREEIEGALKMQHEINGKNERITAIKSQIAKKPEGIDPKQVSLIEDVLNANTRCIHAVNYIKTLRDKRNEILTTLTKPTEVWDEERLSVVKEALALRKSETYPSVADHIAALKREIAIFKGLTTKLTKEQEQDFNRRQVLLSLLEMSPETLEKVLEAVNIQLTLQHAEKELVQLRIELEAKKAVIVTYEKDPVTNVREWTEAKKWMQLVLGGKEEINRISKEIELLEKELDTKLGLFQAVSGELIRLLGLDAKEDLELPPFLQEKIWPWIETAKNQYISRMLFAQLGEVAVAAPSAAGGIAGPLMQPIIGRDLNRALLQEKSGSDFLGHLCQALAKDVLTLFPTLVSPEAIAEKIGESMPSLDPTVKGILVAQFKQFITESSATYKSGSDLASAYVEGILLKIFIGIAERNPKQAGKDTLVVLTEKLLGLIAAKYQEVRAGKKVEVATKELNDLIMKDVLGISSADAFEGLPEALKVTVYDLIKDQIGEKLFLFQKSVADFESGPTKAAKDKSKELGIAAGAAKGYTQILAEDIANMVMASVPHVMTEETGQGMKGVALISQSIKETLKELAQGNFAIAEVLLKYTRKDKFKQILEDQLVNLDDPGQWVEDKKRAAELLANLLLPYLNGVIERIINFENKHQKEFNQKLMAKFLRIGAQRFTHPAVPTQERKTTAYASGTQAIMKMMFPNGQEDLQFVPKEIRAMVWKMLEKNLFPQILPMMTEIMFDPMMITTTVLNSLETMRDNLQGPIVVDPNPEPEDRPLDELDEASGELIAGMLNTMTLPEWIKNKMMVDGKVTPVMKKSLGATLRKQFNDTFIQDKLKMALEKMVQRDQDGNPLLGVDERPQAIKAVEAAKKAQKMQTDLKKVSREIVMTSISYFIRSKWANAQASFDQLVKKIFGNIGLKLKHALDACFRFIFFTIVGSILSVLFWPAKQLIKQMIYKTIKIDQNLDALLTKLTSAPADQPATANKYSVYNEDLLFKMGEALSEVVQEQLKVPVSLKVVGTPT